LYTTFEIEIRDFSSYKEDLEQLFFETIDFEIENNKKDSFEEGIKGIPEINRRG